jgi:hypothetical protein
MRQPALLFILKGEMDWHRNSRQAPWKLSSTDKGDSLIEAHCWSQFGFLAVGRQTGSNSRFQLVGIALLVIQGIPEIA